MRDLLKPILSIKASYNRPSISTTTTKDSSNLYKSILIYIRA